MHGNSPFSECQLFRLPILSLFAVHFHEYGAVWFGLIGDLWKAVPLERCIAISIPSQHWDIFLPRHLAEKPRRNQWLDPSQKVPLPFEGEPPGRLIFYRKWHNAILFSFSISNYNLIVTEIDILNSKANTFHEPHSCSIQ